MRYPWLSSLLISICLLAVRPGWAQRAGIAPLVPRTPAVRPVKLMGQPVAPQPAPIRKLPPVLAQRPAFYPDPLYILNSSVIINGLLKDINPKDIKKLVVYKKDADAPPQWRGLAIHGIIDFALKKKNSIKIKSLRLDELGKNLGLAGPVSYSVNGMPVATAELRIAAAAIGEIRITHATAAVPTAVVEIQTTSLKHEAPSPRPPGTILIRGTASL